jgi:hypothetical protein
MPQMPIRRWPSQAGGLAEQCDAKSTPQLKSPEVVEFEG